MSARPLALSTSAIDGITIDDFGSRCVIGSSLLEPLEYHGVVSTLLQLPNKPLIDAGALVGDLDNGKGAVAGGSPRASRRRGASANEEIRLTAG